MLVKERTSAVARAWKAGLLTGAGPAYLVTVALLLVAGLIQKNFDSPTHVITLLNLAAVTGIAAAGQTFAILSGGIDLSIGSVISFTEVMSVQWTLGNNAHAYLLVLVVAVGVAIGLINGLGSNYLKIPPLIMTLGVGTALDGLLLVLTQGSPVGQAPPALANFMTRNFLGLPGPLWSWIVVAVLTILVLRRTAFGRRVYAVGTNSETAKWSGVQRHRVIVGVYVVSAVAAALAGIVLAGYTGSGYLGIGSQYTIPSVAAVVLGGTSIMGGRGGYGGTIAGVIILGILGSLLALVNIAAAGQDVIEGLALLVVLAIYGRERAKS